MAFLRADPAPVAPSPLAPSPARATASSPTTAADPALVFATPAPTPDLPPLPPAPTPLVRTPADELSTIQLPPGYHLELVLSEPDILEPVLCSFDGNGRMYVAEMRSYMQTADATGEHAPVSRVSRHESSRRDGHFDLHTVFADHLVLPRSVLPLDRGQVLVGLSNTFDITLFRDSRDQGAADGRETFYQGGPNGENMEHQPSGLLWSLDNWIYTTYNSFRLRWNPAAAASTTASTAATATATNGGPALKEPTSANGGQWGVCQDDHGKLWWSNAGAEKPLWHFQTHSLYGSFDVDDQADPDFATVWPATGLADFQGGLARSRPDRTLNHFTGCGGQEVFRGDRLPADLRGDILLPEPVGRLIRRVRITERDGVTHLGNPYAGEHGEFIRSTDPYFRPVFATTGPDGCLYIVDMYRGIIQEGEWTRRGSYLRRVVDQYGLDKTVGHGRVWRLVHDGFTPGPQPRMLDETPAQLVAHLSHPNGWWRDQAQKLLVLRQDKSVVPALVALARTGPAPLGRLHALWTLEGLAAATPDLVREILHDPDPQLRVAAIRVSESLFKAGDTSLADDIAGKAKDPDPDVVLQTVETAKALHWPSWQAQTLALASGGPSPGVRLVANGLLYEPQTFSNTQYGVTKVKLLTQGQTVYRQLCFACHGVDGHGMPMDGGAPGATLAPPLARSATVLGPHQGMVSVLLHGAVGPIHGKSYDALMPPMGTNDDEWIAAVVSYVRNSFGNRGTVVTPAQVAAVRAATQNRVDPWTLDELRAAVVPQPLGRRERWKASASDAPERAPLAVDGAPETIYTSAEPQHPGQWFQIELPEETPVAGLVLDAGAATGDYPRRFAVQLSGDGETWGRPVAAGEGTGPLTEMPFVAPARARFIRVVQTAGSRTSHWSIAEAQVLAPPGVGGAAGDGNNAPSSAPVLTTASVK